MRELIRAWCPVCGEQTTWEADENGPRHCLDGEHLEMEKLVRQRRPIPARKPVPTKPLTIPGAASSTMEVAFENVDKTGV